MKQLPVYIIMEGQITFNFKLKRPILGLLLLCHKASPRRQRDEGLWSGANQKPSIYFTSRPSVFLP